MFFFMRSALFAAEGAKITKREQTYGIISQKKCSTQRCSTLYCCVLCAFVGLDLVIERNGESPYKSVLTYTLRNVSDKDEKEVAVTLSSYHDRRYSILPYLGFPLRGCLDLFELNPKQTLRTVMNRASGHVRMRKLLAMNRLRHIFVLFTLLGLGLNAIPALSQIGHYVVIMPTLISSGDYAGDYDIKAAKVQGDGLVGWGGTAPKPLSEMPVREFWPTAVADGNDGFFLAYTIEHTDSENLGDRDILIRRIDKDGNDIWDNQESGPMLLLAQSSHFEERPHMVAAGDGLIVFYEVRYSDAEHEGDVDVAAIRVNPDGTIPWESAAWIANTKNVEKIVGAYSDGYGNAVVLVQTTVRSSGENSEESTHDLLLYRVGQTGTTGWNADASQSQIVAGSLHDERNATLTPDGKGGAFIAYELRYITGPRKGDVDIIAQHVNADGHRSWIDPAAPPVVSSNARAKELYPSIATDSLGVIVSFQMEFEPNSAESKTEGFKMVGVQRLDHNGKAVWNNGERAQVMLAKNRTVERPSVLTDGTGSAFVLMIGRDTVTGDNDVFIQKIDKDGTRQWGQKGYAIPAFSGPMPETSPTGFTDKYGGLVVFAVQQATYRVATSSTNDSTIVAQRLNDRGERSWGTGNETNLTVTRGELGDYMPTVVQCR